MGQFSNVLQTPRWGGANRSSPDFPQFCSRCCLPESLVRPYSWRGGAWRGVVSFVVCSPYCLERPPWLPRFLPRPDGGLGTKVGRFVLPSCLVQEFFDSDYQRESREHSSPSLIPKTLRAYSLPLSRGFPLPILAWRSSGLGGKSFPTSEMRSATVARSRGRSIFTVEHKGKSFLQTPRRFASAKRVEQSVFFLVGRARTSAFFPRGCHGGPDRRLSQQAASANLGEKLRPLFFLAPGRTCQGGLWGARLSSFHSVGHKQLRAQTSSFFH